MKNEKGVTLIELLGVLVILSIVLTLAGSILTSSLKTSNRATADQRLQQEANYITEAIRNKYLEKIEEHEEDREGKIKIKIENNQLFLDHVVISEGYIYSFCLEEESEEDGECWYKEIKRSNDRERFTLKLMSKDEKHSHEINTTFSKLK